MPRAAEQAAWVVTQMTPQKAKDLFERIRSMEPSKSSLDRLPKAIGDRWENAREANEQVLREAIVGPDGARSVTVSLDGVLAPVDGGNSPTEVRNAAAAEGRLSKGPAGYREVGCATLAFCDAHGDLISAIRVGRGPEHKKTALKQTLAKDLARVLSLGPDLRLCNMTGSGVVEAACKTLVAQRLKLNGMRWGARGAQAILTMRGWDQSERFDAAWALVAATYHAGIHILANGVDITPKPERKRRRA